ncbi:MAG: alpha/beta hydrolase [Myxococcaceae bacterium]|nr:alpha/beta hydrolase [Myxococcaceae bacterium]
MSLARLPLPRHLLAACAAALLACTTTPGASGSGGGAGAAGGGTATSSGGGAAGGALGGGSGGGRADAGTVTTVRIHYPPGTHTLTLRGSRPPLSWNAGVALVAGAEDTFTFSTTALDAPLELKPLLDDATWSRGPNYTVAPGATLEVYPHFVTQKGTWSRRWPAVSSTVLGNTRGVWVYLPPTAAENARARFPVVYMHDGQNLFDPQTAYGNNPWLVQDALDQGAEDGTIREAIVVGPENTADRIGEYTPTASASYPGSGKGDRYLRFLVEELKAKVDAELPTLPGRADTVIAGSSLGGLISAHAGVTQPETFGRVGALSPSTWWDGRVLLTTVAATRPAPARPLAVYLDCGTVDDGQADTTALAAAYRTLGYQDGATLSFVVQQGAAHNETYWRQRLPGAFRFLLGPGR